MQVVKQKPIFIIFFAALLTAGVIILLFHTDSKINRENIAYLGGYGWQVEEPAEISRLTIPQEFDIIYQTYQEVIAPAGFDLSSYQGKTLTRYSYPVLNHQGSGTGLIRANVLVFRNKIVAADLSSLERGGFLKPIHDTTGQQEISVIP